MQKKAFSRLVKTDRILWKNRKQRARKSLQNENNTRIFGKTDKRGARTLAVLSGSRKKEVPTRVRIRPVELKGQILYQASSTVGQKVLHKNYTREELISYMENCLEGTYSQLQVQGQHMDGTVLVSKKGKKHQSR